MRATPEFKVGLTVLAAAVLLAGGIMWGTGFRYRAETTPVTVRYDNVYGIGVDGPVTIGGVRAGKVTGVALEDGRVRIDLELDGSVTLPAGSRIFVKNDGLMGGKFIAIELGPGPGAMDLSRPVDGTVESSVSDIMGAVGGMLAGMERTVDGLDRLLGSGRLETSLFRSLDQVERMVGELAALVRGNRPLLDAAVADAGRAARAMGDAVGGKGDALGRAVDDLTELSARARAVMERLDGLTESLKKVSDKVEKNEGTLGKLVNSDELHRRMVTSIGQLDSLVADVKRNPGKYTKGIKLELF